MFLVCYSNINQLIVLNNIDLSEICQDKASTNISVKLLCSVLLIASVINNTMFGTTETQAEVDYTQESPSPHTPRVDSSQCNFAIPLFLF